MADANESPAAPAAAPPAQSATQLPAAPVQQGRRHSTGITPAAECGMRNAECGMRPAIGAMIQLCLSQISSSPQINYQSAFRIHFVFPCVSNCNNSESEERIAVVFGSITFL